MPGGTPEQLEDLLQFRPWPDAPVVAHLSRELHLARDHAQIADFAARFAGRVSGLVLHDHEDMVSQPADFLRAACHLESRLQSLERAPMLFLEYAAGLAPDLFAGFFGAIRELACVSACVDVGHVGIRAARAAYAARHPGVDICRLKERPADLPRLMPEVESAVAAALPAVLRLIEDLSAPGKHVHFHLHDGHPLSTFSPFGVSDHLSFLAEIPLDFECRSRVAGHVRRSAPLMFGPAGLARIVTTALARLGRERVSFTLEIHPVPGLRLPLGDAAGLFGLWADKNNAEQMNHWLAVLEQNHALLLETLAAAAGQIGTK
jgi:hypothetical protein